MSIHKILSILLEYPTEEMRRHHFEIRRRAAADLDDAGLKRIDAFLSYAGSIDLIDLQAEYVQTFDQTPEHSLHLTHHVFGEDKARGPALIDLSELYRRHGLEIGTNELPDYLPLILEFTDQIPAAEACRFLADAGKVLEVLTANLERSGSPWANLLHVVVSLCGDAAPLVCGEVGAGEPAACVAPCGGEIQ